MEEISMMTSRSSELCFKKDDFTAEGFSVDRFVSEYRKQMPLETLKEDLGLFLKVLQSAMVELINKDYADFVNLSTNLVGLDKSINNLSTPIEKIKEEVTDVCNTLDDTLQLLQKLLKEREDTHTKKTQIQRVMCVLEGIKNIEKQNLRPVEDKNQDVLPYELIERVAVELNRVQFHVSLTSNVRVVREKQALVEELSDILLQHLELMFLHSLTNNNQESLFKVLRIYSSIDKIREVECKFRMQIVRPYMRRVINETIIATEGIDQMYNHILHFVPQNCSAILNVTRIGKKDVEILKEYDFLVNAVWPEIVICLDYIAATVFAPGNPSLFHRNYTASMVFLEKFEQLCVFQASVKRLREHPSYESFMKKWNVLVYFEIRFEEIGGWFEAALQLPFQRPNVDTSYHLNATVVLWKCIALCWDSDVYIKSLCSEFWKLTLQLLSRYYVWANKTIEDSSKDDFLGDSIFQNSQSTTDDESSCVSLLCLVKLLQDVELSMREMQRCFKEVISPKLLAKKGIFLKVMKQRTETFNQLPEQIGKIIIKRLTAQCSQHLKLITDIPRLYRKTNREIPSKPSTYVALVFNPLETFFSQIEIALSPSWKAKWTGDVIDNVIQQCFSMVADVITSVKKMEDSLKRLKKARDKSVGPAVSGIMSDDDKIRHQLLIDVQHFGTMIEKFQIKKTNINYKKLEDLVQSTIKVVSVNL